VTGNDHNSKSTILTDAVGRNNRLSVALLNKAGL